MRGLALEAGDRDRTLAALSYLERLGTAATAAVPAVAKLTQAADPGIRNSARRTLAALR